MVVGALPSVRPALTGWCCMFLCGDDLLPWVLISKGLVGGPTIAALVRILLRQCRIFASGRRWACNPLSTFSNPSSSGGTVV